MIADLRQARFPMFALFCACLAPYAAFYEANWQQVVFWQTSEALLGLLALFGVLALVCIVLGQITRWGVTPFALVGATFVSAFFFYIDIFATAAPLLAAMGFSPEGGSAWAYWLLVACVSLIMAYFGRNLITRFAISFYFIAGLASPTILLATSHQAKHRKNIAIENRQEDFQFARLSGENVYWIAPDGYAGLATLDRFYGFDNSPFLNHMQDMGFAVMKGRSNAIATHVSFATILYMNYLPEGSGLYADRSLLYPSMLDNTATPPLLSVLLDHGYKLFFSGNTWSGCTGVVMTCIGEISELSYASRTILGATPLAPLIVRYAPASFDAITPMVEKLPELLSHGPFFTLVHHLSPHPPYTLDASCGARNAPDLGNVDKVGYLASIRCVNKMLDSAVQRIRRQDPSAIIVIQSDHGGELFPQWENAMATWDSDFVQERAHNIGMVLAPAACQNWLRPDMGQINMARFVLGCLARKEPAFLDEKTMLTTYETSSEFGTVRYHRFADAVQ